MTSSTHKAVDQIDKIGKGKLFILGYDLTAANIKFLENGLIDFLICQKSITQGYQGMLAIFDMLIQKRSVEKINYMPLVIITKENYKYYIDFASAYGIENILLDEGWYTLGDLSAIVPEIDMEEIISYANEKNVGVILWCAPDN